MPVTPAAAIKGSAFSKGPAVLVGGMPAIRQLPSFLLVVLLLYSSVTVEKVSGAERCQFPEEWRGRWYQGGLGEVVIKDTAISKKGVCRTLKNNFYVLEDRDDNCKRCLYMMRQHRNVIQYKEGYCIGGKHTIKEVCQYLGTEAILHTLVREPSVPVRCPFQGAYFFSYNNNTGGECKTPMSYIQPCASAAKYSFNFKSCSSVPHAFERDLKFECLATWRDGSDTFIYGGFSGYGVISRDHSYRCFKFKALGRQMYMSMSADPSCLGLVGPHNGPLTMELTTDTLNWPTAGCKFPDFFDDINWIDLSGKHYYHLNTKKTTMTVDYKRTSSTKPNTKYAFRCVAIRHQDKELNEYTYITHSSHGCDAEKRCLRLRLRRPNMMEITLGRVLYDEGEDCDETKFTDVIVHIALPETLRSQMCPAVGKYNLDKSSGCDGHMNIGCNSSHTMNLQASCHPQQGVNLECLMHWWEKGRMYMIARGHHKDSHSNVANCFSLQKIQNNKLQFFTEESCNLEVSSLLGRRANPYILKSPAAPCSHKDSSHSVHEQKPRQKQERKKEREERTQKQANNKQQNNNNVDRNNVEPEGPLESTTGSANINSLHSSIWLLLLPSVFGCLSRTVLLSGGWIL